MVGLNHEFARELLWREYPDRSARLATSASSGTSAALSTPPGLTPSDALRERLLRHPRAAPLAADVDARRRTTTASARRNARRGRAGHPRRAAQEVPDRGDLRAPRRSGTMTDGRHRPDQGAARWSTLAGRGDAAAARPRSGPRCTRPRSTPTSTSSASTSPSPRRKGGTGRQPDDDPGWFFVIKERPGEPRFGLDDRPRGASPRSSTTSPGRTPVPGITTASFLPAAALASITLAARPRPRRPEKLPQHDRRRQVAWRRRQLRPVGLPAVPGAGHGRRARRRDAAGRARPEGRAFERARGRQLARERRPPRPPRERRVSRGAHAGRRRAPALGHEPRRRRSRRCAQAVAANGAR